MLLMVLGAAAASETAPIPSVFDEEVARFRRLAACPIDELRIEAAQGFYHCKHRSGETALLPLADVETKLVRLTVVKALGVCGGRRTVPVLIKRLRDPEWDIREAAHAGLLTMTGQAFPAAAHNRWKAWLDGSDWAAREADLIAMLKKGTREERVRALRALRFVGSVRAEPAVLAALANPGPIGGHGALLGVKALERIGSRQSLPALERCAVIWPDTAWALGEIGGPEAEEALLKGFRRFGTWTIDNQLNLDRVGCTRTAEFLPVLLNAFGLVIFRSQPDELHRPPPVGHRVAANLILRSGQADRVVDLILAEVEGTRNDADTPPNLRELLRGMQHELKPGFVRSDGMTVAQPLAALPHITKDRRFVPRLVALLRHPAFIVRIYAAMTLAALEARETVPAILAVIREPYPFPDAATMTSGKHFDRSHIVRWRGYVCMALGRLGGVEARKALEALAVDSEVYRDIRYGAVVGLRFLGSPLSISALERIAEQDIIWAVRETAARAVEDIRLRKRFARFADRHRG